MALTAAEEAVSFGPFQLFPERHLLLEADNVVRVGSRALDILIALVDRAGELVGKEELIARAWPDTFVEEGNLRVHVAALRRALGDGQAGSRYVANVPGRGYRFVAPVSRGKSAERPVPPAVVEPAHNLPAPLTRMVGRAGIVDALAAEMPRQRLITIAGPGGIGKTTVALAVADRLVGSYRDAVRYVDLASLTDPLLVPSTLAAILGLAIRTENPLPGLVAFLKDKEMLLVLDGCERVIDAAAALAEELIRNVAGVHILATSREPLRATGERVRRLAPLDVPPISAGLTAETALRHSAVQLFVERAAASLDTFELSDADAPVVAEICGRLDGIALAIELAAGRVDAFGVAGLAALLDDRFRLLTRGRRTALPRHQTLAATLDWSYESLPEAERMVFRRLAIFAGGFTLESAGAVVALSDIVAADVVDHIANLVAKSLVAADVSGAIVHYRLLETTGAYALVKLVASGEFEDLARRHAEYCRDLFERAEAESVKRPTTEWLAEYTRQIENLRKALDWAFSPGGDAEVGVALTSAAVPLFMHHSLVEECRRRVERALAALDAGGEPRHDMKLHAALGSALVHQKGSGPDIVAEWNKALAIAEQLGDREYQLRALWGLWADQSYRSDYRAALPILDRYRSLAANSPDPVDVLVGARIYGVILHSRGDQAEARGHIEHVLRHYVTSPNRSHILRYQYDQHVSASSAMALIRWVQGFPDEAMSTVKVMVEEALSIDHALSLCSALANTACSLALVTGDLNTAERYVTMLLDQSFHHGIAVWHAWGRCHQGVLVIKQGDAENGVRTLRDALEAFPSARFGLRYSAFCSELAEALGRRGDVAGALTVIDEALERSERNEERWYIAEMLRVKGELLLLENGPNAVALAEDQFRTSLDLARRQQVLSWELRTATSIARLQRDKGQIAEGREQLADVYGRFSEGFGTADLQAAKALLDDLSSSA